MRVFVALQMHCLSCSCNHWMCSSRMHFRNDLQHYGVNFCRKHKNIGVRVCPKQFGRPCSIWSGPCTANVCNTQTLLAFECWTLSRSVSTRMMPPDDASRPCFSSTACLIQEPALLRISSTRGGLRIRVLGHFLANRVGQGRW